MIACKQVSETTRALHLSIFEQPAFIVFSTICQAIKKAGRA
jgi:hypothetical protein